MLQIEVRGMLLKDELSEDMRKLLGKISVGNYEDFLDKIDDESVDLLLTDIPYNIQYKNHAWDNGDEAKGGFNLEKWIGLVSSKIKKTGTAVIFCGDYQVGDLVNGLLDNGFGNPTKKSTWPRLNVWYKPNARDRRPNKRQAKVFEAYIVATKSKNHTFNLRLETQLQGKRYEEGLLSFSSSEDNQHRLHDTQKPYQLWKALVEMYSNPGDLILDTFSGSGVTAVTASYLDRNFIAIERERAMARKSKIRLALAQQDAVKPEYFYNYQPKGFLPKSKYGTLVDKAILNDLLRLQHDYDLASDVEYDIDGLARSLTAYDLEEAEVNYAIVSKNHKKYLIAYSGNNRTEGNGEKSKAEAAKLKGVQQVEIGEVSGARKKKLKERADYYYYLWFFLAKINGDTDLNVDFAGMYEQEMSESAVVNGLVGASNDIGRLYDETNYFTGYTAEEISDALNLNAGLVEKYHLQYLPPKQKKLASRTMRWRRKHGFATTKKMYKNQREDEAKERARQVKRDYEALRLSDKEFLENYQISRATFYKYKRVLWPQIKAEAKTTKELKKQIKHLKEEVKRLKEGSKTNE